MSSIYEHFIPTAESSSYQLLLLLLMTVCAHLLSETEADLELVVGSKSIAI